MLVCGIAILAGAEPGRSHTLSLVLGWALIVQTADAARDLMLRK